MSGKYLRTIDLAKAAGIHINTVRLYEEWGFLPPIPRSPSGYRLYTEEHRDQLLLARTALHFPYPGGKGPVLGLVHRARDGDLRGALELGRVYLDQIHTEQARGAVATDIVRRWARGETPEGGADEPVASLSIGETARAAGVTIDALRSWERNQLIAPPRDAETGYRQYGSAELARIRVIRLLRAAGHSAVAIRRMMRRLAVDASADPIAALDTPGDGEEEDAIYISDRWLTTLAAQERRAHEIIALLQEMIGKRAAQNS